MIASAVCVSFPTSLDEPALVSELNKFLEFRRTLIALFGVQDELAAQAAIQLCSRALHDPELVQIHVLRAGGRIGKDPTRSFLNPPEANEVLVASGFYRFRYASVEQPSGNQYFHPGSVTLVRAWAKRAVSEWHGPAQAALIATTTSIDGRHDSDNFFLLQRAAPGQWQLAWACRFCDQESRAWGVGMRPISREDLPQCSRLQASEAAVEQVIARHRSSLRLLQVGTSTVRNAAELISFLAEEREWSQQGPDALIARLTHLLTAPAE